MAERIAGRNGADTIIDDHYGFGSIQTGPPARPENPDAYARSRPLEDDDIQKETGWNGDQLEMARAYLGFPQGELVPALHWWDWNKDRKVRVTQRHAMNVWLDHARALGFKL